jgi:hypothetical protein
MRELTARSLAVRSFAPRHFRYPLGFLFDGVDLQLKVCESRFFGVAACGFQVMEEHFPDGFQFHGLSNSMADFHPFSIQCCTACLFPAASKKSRPNYHLIRT